MCLYISLYVYNWNIIIGALAYKQHFNVVKVDLIIITYYNVA